MLCKICTKTISNKEIWLDTDNNSYHKECVPTGIRLMGEEAKEDMVNHPSHYASGGIECIDAISEAVKGLDGIEAMDTGNAIKYLWRWKRKGGKQDLEKARWYIDHLINKL